MASQNGHLECVRLLLKVKAPVNHRSAKDATPLIAATIGGHEPVVRMLLKAGADVTARTGIPGTSTDGIPGTLEVHSLPPPGS